MQSPNWVSIGAAGGFTAVLMGAFGSHALHFLPAENLSTYRIAVLYQFFHSLGILGLALFELNQTSMKFKKNLRRSCFFFGLGIVLFSGSLYLLSLTDLKKIGMITPIGGVFFLAGWGNLFYASLRLPAKVEK